MAERSLTQLVAFDNASQAEDNGNPRRWAILIVLSAVAFMAQLDFFIVNVALAGIGKDFPNSGLTGVSWVLNAYAIVFAAALVFAGRIVDLRGRKKVLLFGVALFTAASVGPPVGGLLVGLSWRWIFLINLPIGIVTIVAGFLLPILSILGKVCNITDSRDPHRYSFDDRRASWALNRNRIGVSNVYTLFAINTSQLLQNGGSCYCNNSLFR